MSQEIDNLKASVHKMTDATDSATTLIKGLADRVRATAGDTQATADLANELDQKAGALAQAVLDNTPAAGGGGTPSATAPRGQTQGRKHA